MVSRHAFSTDSQVTPGSAASSGLESLDDDVGGFLEFVGRVADERGAGQRE